MSFVSVAIGSSILSEFEYFHGDPMNNIFSSKLNIYLLVLLPIINIILNYIINHIYNNKEKEFKYLDLSIEEVRKIYRKSWTKGIIGTLSLVLLLILCFWAPLSGSRSVAIYSLDVILISDIPDYFGKKRTYREIQKEFGDD